MAVSVILNLNRQHVFGCFFVIQISIFGHGNLSGDGIHIKKSLAGSAKNLVGQIVSVLIRGLCQSYISVGRAVFPDVERLGRNIRGIVHVSQRDRHCRLVRQSTVILNLDIQRVSGCLLIIQISTHGHGDLSGDSIHVEKSLSGSADNMVGQIVSVRIACNDISHACAARAVLLNYEIMRRNIRRFAHINHSDSHNLVIRQVSVILNPDIQYVLKLDFMIQNRARRHSELTGLGIHIKQPLSVSADNCIGQAVPVSLNLTHDCVRRTVFVYIKSLGADIRQCSCQSQTGCKNKEQHGSQNFFLLCNIRQHCNSPF